MNPDRIRQMETSLNAIRQAARDLQAQLEQLKACGQAAKDLYAYYGSEDWYQDREAELPEGMQAGVLSEDAVYDSITELRDTAFDMLELGTDVLKNWI